jgi:hypothetical protein
MRCRSFFTVLAIVLGSTQLCDGGELTETGCNTIGCVRPTNAFEQLSKIAEGRFFSTTRVTEPGNLRDLCGAGTCATEPRATSLPESCGRAGCAPAKLEPRPAAAAANDTPSTSVSTLVTDTFAAVAKRPMGLVPWAEWTQRGGLGGLYDARQGSERHRL